MRRVYICNSKSFQPDPNKAFTSSINALLTSSGVRVGMAAWLIAWNEFEENKC